ncbi:tegument protein VP22 [Equid alphaherpesvirus 1]|uniref:Tegument protein VP22 n=1 Tax=Equid alphaherpesvirus 1 TaxID=10326 RepID=A0A0A7D9Q5_9ALPH|nr:tegument protein EUL49 [Equid alphaherpesvirus 1]AKQ19054.1 tegument protein VP22 [Equid alphaherpesvirus 1]AMD81974.1 tegument protein VP22 [Equid alphaherpesvirus 1]AMK49350.1 tegument protein VP22 [Equid alphaherpesvirus 1]AMK49426.1 tegument protein VP22 [Equid alphaherpesvirus 1]
MSDTWRRRRSGCNDANATEELVYSTVRSDHRQRRPSRGTFVMRENDLYDKQSVSKENDLYESASPNDDKVYTRRGMSTAAHYRDSEHIYETCEGDEFYDACEYSLIGGGKLSTSNGRQSPAKAQPPPRGAAAAPPPRVPTRPPTRAAATSTTPRQQDCAPKQRASPGVNSIKSGKGLAFSGTPKTPKSQWYGATHLFNKTVFCAAVSRVAAAHASDAASALWDLNPPKTNEDLDRFLKAAAIRILVCEGAQLLEVANSTMESTPDGYAAAGPNGYDRRPRTASRRRSLKCKPPADDFFDDTNSG